MTESVLDQAMDLAFTELEKVGGELDRLAEPFRTVAIIASAQGVIDNGGLRFFFEKDWPGQPPYSLFAEAYQEIRATAAADAIDAAAALFAFPEPERSEERRHAVLASATGARIDDLASIMDDEVWARLAEFVETRRASFAGPPA